MKLKQDFNSEKEYFEYLRIQFAALAMQGLISSDHVASFMPDECAKSSVQYADALINELNKTEKQ